jgi:serine/threonine-protein kinase
MDLDEASAKRVGTTLKEKWILEQLIGVGGMASVYVGRHKIGRREAIKILHPEIARSEELRSRFEQEARAVNSFRHPGVVEVRDVDVSEDGSPFLVMELLEGESLAARVRREKTTPVADVVRIASEVLDVLAAAHERQIIHRDIKPDNLFLTQSGAVKVLDFGIARVRSADGRAMRTQAGVTLGTMAYMPPEQARGLEIDARADLYAVGATMYRLLTGRIVHAPATDAELVMKAMTDPAPPLTSVAPTLPPSLCAVVDRALAFDRANRYPDARTMKADLEALGRGEPPPYASAAPPMAPPVPASTPSPQREAPTVAPPAKVVATPAASAKATSLGVAPEVAPTRLTPIGVPSAALPSVPVVPSSPTVVSGASSSTVIIGKTQIPPTVVYAIIAGFAVFLILGIIAIIVLASSGPRAAEEPVPPSADVPTVAAPSPPPPPPSKKKDKGKGHGRE